MAVAAETINHVRSPQSEIYGRSLSTIYRLGALMVEKTVSEAVDSPEAEQAKVEFFTSVEEGFGTDEELGKGLEVRDFDERAVIDGRVMAKDLKTPVSDMTEAGLICAEDKFAEESAQGDQRFLPQLIRSQWDHNNALIVDKMVQGETSYNTRIVPSLFPKEAAAQSGNDYWRDIGYVPHLERGFMQLYYAGEDRFVSGSLSFDGSDMQRLRGVFRKHGIDIPETEKTDNCLQYAITATLSETEAKELAIELADQAGNPEYQKTTNTVEVTSEHRAVMDIAFDESYVHICKSLFQGRQTPEARKLVFQLADKAGHFNSRYRDALYKMRAIEEFSDDDSIVLHEILVYSTIETMRALHLQATDQAVGKLDASYIQALDSASFQDMLSSFGAVGARNNRVYAACGLAISLGAAESQQHAFGGLDREQQSWHGGGVKHGTCVNCNKETAVGVKNWCKSCIKC